MADADAHALVSHQFDDAEQEYEANNLGMWVFLATEVLFFGGVFLGYIIYRSRFPEAFHEGSRHLDVVLGTVNTAVLLVSSLTMALAVHAAQTSRRKALVGFLLVTMALGLTFLGIKGVEYHHKFVEHLYPGGHFDPQHLAASVNPNNLRLFFSFYFAATGLHALHMIIGIGIMTVLTIKAARGRYRAERYTPVEIAGLYWHFVDIVWVYLFPLFYLIG